MERQASNQLELAGKRELSSTLIPTSLPPQVTTISSSIIRVLTHGWKVSVSLIVKSMNGEVASSTGNQERNQSSTAMVCMMKVT